LFRHAAPNPNAAHPVGARRLDNEVEVEKSQRLADLAEYLRVTVRNPENALAVRAFRIEDAS